MVKRILFLIVIAVILIPATFLLIRYIAYVKDTSPDKTFLTPQIDAAIVELTGISRQKVEMIVKLKINNPLPFTLTADSFSFRLSMDGQKIIYSTYTQSVSVKRNDSTWISLPLSVLRQDINAISSRADQQQKDSVMYVLDATFYTHIPFKKSFNVQKIKLLPVIHILSLKINKIEIDSLKFSNASLTIHTLFINKNAFPLNFSDINYTMLIQNHQWATGGRNGKVHIPAKSNTEIDMPMHVNFKQIGKTAFDLLTKSDSVDYDFTVTLKLVTENKSIKNNKVVIESAGKLKPLLKALKKHDN